MKKLHLLFLIFLLLLTGACSKNAAIDTFELPMLKTAILPTFQPQETTELIAGYFPENRILANESQLKQVSSLLKTKVSAINPRIEFIDSYDENEFINKIDTEQTKGMLAYWIALGKHKGIDLLILPQVSYYNDTASSGKPNTATALMIDFFLIDTRNEGTLLKRAHFAEEVQNDDDESKGMLSFSRRIGNPDMPSIINDAFDEMIEVFDLTPHE